VVTAYVSTGSPIVIYAQLLLKDVAITHYRYNCVKDDQSPQEIITFAYSSMQKTFTPRNKDNTCYDLNTASQV